MNIGDLDSQHRQALIDELYDVQRSLGELRAREKNIQLQLSAMNIQLGRSSNDVFARIFKAVARRILPKEWYDKIIDGVHEKLKWANRRIEGDDNGEQ